MTYLNTVFLILLFTLTACGGSTNTTNKNTDVTSPPASTETPKTPEQKEPTDKPKTEVPETSMPFN